MHKSIWGVPNRLAGVIALNVAMILIAGVQGLSHAPYAETNVLTPVLVGVTILLVERHQFEILDGREPLTFSLLQVPLAAGVVLLSGPMLLLVAAIGRTGALVLDRTPLVKSVFNLTNVVLQASVAVAVFSLLDPPGGFGLSAIAAGVAATLAGTVLATIMVLAAIAASDGAIAPRSAAETILFAAVLATASATFSLLAIEQTLSRSWSSAVLVGVLPTVLVAYRSLVNSRDQRIRLQFFAAVADPLSSGLRQEEAVEVLLSETARMFRAAHVELVLWKNQDEAAYHAYSATGLSTLQLDPEAVAGLQTAVAELPISKSHLVANADTPMGKWLAQRGLKESIVSRLQSGTVDHGLLVVANRKGAVSFFSSTDVDLFSALRVQVASALEADRLANALTQLTELEQELSTRLHHDALTGLPNRLHLTSHIESLRVGDHGIDLLFIDLDDFKLVNDTLGHASGDQLLIQTSKRIQGCLRDGNFLARLGGDEFAISVRGTGDGVALARRIVETVRQPITLGSSTVSVGCSIGIASSSCAEELSTALERADMAMYAAKGQGKDGLVVYSDRLGNELIDLQRQLQSLQNALGNGALQLHYQPIFSGTQTDGPPKAVEALVRWSTPDGLVSAASFIPAAEQSSLVMDIDRWVFRQVLRDMGNLDHFDWVSVNLSSRNLHDEDLVAWLVDATTAAGVSPAKLMLEITETAAMLDVEASIATLEQLRALGFGVALDDFGTGYSSIAYLRRLPVSVVKVDQSFMQDLDQVGGPALLQAIIMLSHTLDLPVIAEGVETSHQLAIAQTAGCEMVQGHLLGKPASLAEVGPLRQSARLLNG